MARAMAGTEQLSCVPSDLLHHVYTFLVQFNFHKSAKALQKATDEVLAANSPHGKGLLQFYAYYQKRHAGKRTATFEGEGEGPPPTKRRKATEHAQDKDEKKRDLEVVKGQRSRKQPKTKVVVEPDDDGGGAVTQSTPYKGDTSDDAEGDTDGGGSGTGSDEDDSGVNGEATPLHTEGVKVNTSEGAKVNSAGKKSKRKRKSVGDVVPFKRVNEEVLVDPRLQDNSFEAKEKSRGSWGEKANKDLKFTKGKSFRHEKTKKKRGSYRGGAIDTSICSIKFDSD